MNKWFFLCCIALCALCRCVPYEEEVLTQINIDYSDARIQQLYDYQDQHLSDSLYPFFDDKDPTYRYLAARSFGSFMDNTAIAPLSGLLDDPVLEVRAMAAYAIGQQFDPSGADPLTRSFDNLDTLGFNRLFNARILEAVGKCGNDEHLSFISTVKNYHSRDTLLVVGQARSIFYFMRRGIVHPDGTQRMLALVTNAATPTKAKIYAAHYFVRATGIDIGDHVEELITALRREEQEDVRVALAAALAKSSREEALPVLMSLLKGDPDFRLRYSILLHLDGFDYERIKADVAAVLQTARNPHVAEAAAMYFVRNGIAPEAMSYRRMALDSLSGPAQLRMLQATNRHLPTYFEQTKNYLNYDLKQRFANADSPYERALILQALSEFPWNYRIVHELGYTDEAPYVKTAAIGALAYIAAHPNFNTYFGLSSRSVSSELAQYFQNAIESADLGVMAAAAKALQAQNLPYEELYDHLDFLKNAQNRIPQPEGIETYNELQKAINTLENTNTPLKKPAFNHPINWQVASVLSADNTATIKTTKGDIVIRLNSIQTPATVSHFIQLAKNSFYDDKVFHRVVPNFVVQVGSERGDEYSSDDYTIRSETPPLYYDGEGMVGMASAGADTESSQFFVTHAPTPHLDGRYTPFAKVISGMDVVYKLTPEDRITNVIITE